MQLDISSFTRAVGQLKKSFAYYLSEPARLDSELQEQFRSATIQAFEYTYDLAIKMIRKQLQQIVANPAEIKELNYLDLIRSAIETGLVQEVTPYKIYRELRNQTSHTYDADSAENIIEEVASFIADMDLLLETLEKRNRPDA